MTQVDSGEINRLQWDERAPAHAASPDYHVTSFARDPGAARSGAADVHAAGAQGISLNQPPSPEIAGGPNVSYPSALMGSCLRPQRLSLLG